MKDLPSDIVQAQPRAIGTLAVGFDARAGCARLTRLHQSGSLRALFPRNPAKTLQMVLTNTSGGVTGGDRFETDLKLDEGACVTVTTQAAERAYRAQPDQMGRVSTNLQVARGAQINWLPQETILFDGCALRRRLTVEVAEEGSALIVEPLVFGRTAMAERLVSGLFDDRIEIMRDGETIFLDRVVLDGDIDAILTGPAVTGGAGAMALVALVSSSAEAHLESVRDMLPENGGASLLAPDLLVIRLVASDSFYLRKSLVPIINLLHDDALPRPWMI